MKVETDETHERGREMTILLVGHPTLLDAVLLPAKNNVKLHNNWCVFVRLCRLPLTYEIIAVIFLGRRVEKWSGGWEGYTKTMLKHFTNIGKNKWRVVKVNVNCPGDRKRPRG